jgi:hypothetical protein
VKKPDVIQKNELYFCNQGSNVIQNQLSKSKHRLKSFVLQACVIEVFFEPFRLLCHLFKSDKKKKNKHDTASVFSSVIRYILDDPIFF